jgi:predicted RNA-binding protein associated with RNAse of E/G family
MSKWGGRPHWEFDASFLGSDEHGDWVGIPAGTFMVRPGATFVTETAQAGLVPRDRGWLATFHAPGYHVVTYVDMTSVPTWDGSVVRAVDLDLDVVKTAEGEVFVDDEDEFAEHRVALGYPADVVALAEGARDEVLAAMRAGTEPFGAHSERWLAVLGGLEP